MTEAALAKREMLSANRVRGHSCFPQSTADPAPPHGVGRRVSGGLLRGATLLLFAMGCEADTGGELGHVTVAVQAESMQDGGAIDRFTTRHGYEVTLTEARMWIGPVYVWAPSGAQTQRGFSLVSKAYAHGGYDPLSGRRIRVERAQSFEVDLLATEALVLDDEVAELGPTDGATLALPPPAAADGATAGHHLWVAGSAHKDGQTIEFAGGIDIADDGLLRRVNGIAADLTLEDGDLVTLHVRPQVLFDSAHFERLSDGDEDGVVELATNTQPYDAIFLGMTDPEAYRVTRQASP